MKLSDTIQDFDLQTFHCSATAATLTHRKRETMQAVWRFLLNAEFTHAYEHGIVIKFPDGIFRHVFPRIFTYAANYPEKYVVISLSYISAYDDLKQNFTWMNKFSWKVSLSPMLCRQRQNRPLG